MQHTWRKDNWAVSTCTVCRCIRKLKRSLRRNKMKYEYIMPGPAPVTTEEPKCKTMKKAWILFTGEKWEGEDVQSVYSTLGKARKSLREIAGKCKKINDDRYESHDGQSFYYIKSFPLQ